MKPTLTIFADASVMTCGAGWGGWAKGDGRPSTFGGGPLGMFNDATAAELMALHAWLTSLRASDYLRRDEPSLIVQSDSVLALNTLARLMPNARIAQVKDDGVIVMPVKRVNPKYGPTAALIAETLRGSSVVYLRHVRGHRGGDTSRSWVNEECDRRAKEGARSVPQEAAE
jgi:ribonuclease HI